MAVTEIETFLSGGTNAAPFAGKIDFADGLLIITVMAAPGGNRMPTLTFSDATISCLWFDEKDVVEWPLDIIGFDSHPLGEKWRFVLNCSSVELSWISGWPSKSV